MNTPLTSYFLEKFFNPKLYCAYKALHFFQQKENGGYSSKTIRANIKIFSQAIGKSFAQSGMDPLTHYREYGTQEGINPSDLFSTRLYLTEKARIRSKNGVQYRAIDIARELKKEHLSALDDFILHAGTGEGEVPFGILPDGSIPKEFSVPEKHKIDVQPPPVPARKFFSAREYIRYKALQFFQQKENGGIDPKIIQENISFYSDAILELFKKSNISAWKHYCEYGTLEEINPSHLFDTKAYTKAKAEALNAAGILQDGIPWTEQSVARLFYENHISALEHFLRYAGTGEGEVTQALLHDGSMPPEFTPKSQKKEILPVQVENIPEVLPETIAFPAPEIKKTCVTKKHVFLTLYCLSILLVFLYLMFIASPMYLSVMKFSVRGQDAGSVPEGFGSLFSLSTPQQTNSYIIQDYITSLNLILLLEKKLKLIAHYSDRTKDPVFRLMEEPTNDKLLSYWEWLCTTGYDPDTNIIWVEIKAFTPEMAEIICREILHACEELVNAMNVRIREDTLHQAYYEVERAEERLIRAASAVRNYQDKTAVVSPKTEVGGQYTLILKLDEAISNITAEIAQAKTYMKPDNPHIRQLENRLKVLLTQREKEKEKLTDKEKSEQTLSHIAGEFHTLSMREEFAQKQLVSALNALEAARMRLDARTQYVEAFEEPLAADESLYPKPFLFTFIYCITSLLLIALFSLIAAAIREHVY